MSYCNWDTTTQRCTVCRRQRPTFIADPTCLGLRAEPTPASPDMANITRCVICGKDLPSVRIHADTCSEPCFKNLLKKQRR